MLHVPLGNDVTPLRALKEGVCVLAQEAFDALKDPDQVSESERIRAAGESVNPVRTAKRSTKPAKKQTSAAAPEPMVCGIRQAFTMEGLTCCKCAQPFCTVCYADACGHVCVPEGRWGEERSAHMRDTSEH